MNQHPAALIPSVTPAISPPAAAAHATRSRASRLLAVRVLAYLTNHVTTHIPVHSLRRAWYGRVLGIDLGPGSAVHLGCQVWFFGPGQLRRDGVRIGANTRVNAGCRLDARGGLSIGDNVSISPEAALITVDHDPNDAGFALRTRSIVVEDNVFIGYRAVILPGVRLGRGAVVAAGAVVTRDVAPLGVVAGVPARQVGWRDSAAADYALDGPIPLFD